MTTAEPELAAFREELERVRSRLAQAHVGEDERVDLAAHESDLLEAIALEEDLLGVGKAGEEGKKSSEQSVEELTRAADERNLDPEAKRALERASKVRRAGRPTDLPIGPTFFFWLAWSLTLRPSLAPPASPPFREGSRGEPRGGLPQDPEALPACGSHVLPGFPPVRNASGQQGAATGTAIATSALGSLDLPPRD